MKRNLDLIREILLKIEEYPEPNGFMDLKMDNYSDIDISYHIKLLYQARLIDAYDGEDSAGFNWKAKSLTWEGHEFLDKARNKTVWENAKSILKTKGLDFSFELLKIVLKEVSISMLK